MKIQLASDLHLEMNCLCQDFPDIIPSAPCLALTGDIGLPISDYEKIDNEHYVKFLTKVSQQFQLVFVIAGNHEFYGTEYYTAKKKLNEVCSQFTNVIFMDRTSYLYVNPEDESDTVRVLGCTLWSNVPDNEIDTINLMMNDYRRIKIRGENDENERPLHARDTVEMHKGDVEFLTEEIQKAESNNENVLILTHHAPSFFNTVAKRHENSMVRTAFATDLESLMRQCVKCWVFGHSHYSTDYVHTKTKGKTRIVSNQLGYLLRKEQVEFNRECVVEVLSRSNEPPSFCTLL